MKIIPGQYYQCIENDMSGDEVIIAKGELVLVTSLDVENVHYSFGKQSYSDTFDYFMEHYELDANGEQKRAEEISRLMRESTDFAADQKAIETAMGNISVSTTELVKSNDPQAAKKQLGMAKGAIIRLQESMLEKQERLMGFIEEKKAFMMAKVEAMNAMVKKVQDVVWAINVYVGTDEDIKQLKEGQPAPETEKVHVRQARLFMDEELAIRDDQGGMDFQDLDTFDKWIVHPEHLQQILPEQRGIVALRVRRDDKKYSDRAIENELLNKNNRVTYILARNGENLYRIWSSLDVEDVLFPRREEFSDIFMDYDGSALKPGTVKYENAMKSADENRKHYMRMVLFLQGIFDRTNFFHPFAKPGVNITNRQECADVIEFIHDAEMQLSDGRPAYDDWLAELNSKLTVGSRIVGWFNQSGFPCYKHRDCSDSEIRVTPPGHCPKDEDIYILEKRDRDGFNFLFQSASREKWSRAEGRYVKVERRVSAYVDQDDRFIINFDDLNPDDITYYLNSRLHRHSYARMFPLLKRARAMKEKELKEEAPFKSLLISQIMREHAVTLQEATTAVPKLVQWWKFKTRLTRSIKSNDTKALKMIVEQFGINQRKEEELRRRDKQVQPVVDAIRAKHPDVVFIGHKDKNTFVALVPANDKNIFVHEQVWRHNITKQVVLDSEKRWVLVDRRRDNWRKLYAADRWAQWEMKHHISEVLTDPEREKLINDSLLKYQQSVENKKDVRYLPLAVTERERDGISIWVCEEKLTIPRTHIVYRDVQRPSLGAVKVEWKRTQNGIEFTNDTANNGYEWFPAGSTIRWIDRHDRGPGDDFKDDIRKVDEWPWCTRRRGAQPLFRVWESNLQIVREEYARYQDFQKRYDALKAIVDEATAAIEAKWRRETEAAAFAKFILENDPHLWEAEKKLKKGSWLHFKNGDKLEELFMALVDMGIPVIGKTMGWCFDQARGKTRPVKKERSHRWGSDDEDEKDTGLLPTEEEIPGLDRDWIVQKEEALAEVEL